MSDPTPRTSRPGRKAKAAAPKPEAASEAPAVPGGAATPLTEIVVRAGTPAAQVQEALPAPSSAPAPAQVAQPGAPSLPRLHSRWAGLPAEAGPLPRFLPEVPPAQLGLRAEFCDLYIYLSHLHGLGWNGYLHLQAEGSGEEQVWALLLRGRAVAASSLRLGTGQSGQEAFGELIVAYQAGGTLTAYPLEGRYVQLLSGLGAAAQEFHLAQTFSGVYARADGAVLYERGEAVALLDAGLAQEGAFAAPASPAPLMLPRHLAGWAHATYQPTLRGRDILSPITAAHSEFRAEFGHELALALMTALIEGQTPAEFALAHDTPLAEIERWLGRFKEQGYLVR